MPATERDDQATRRALAKELRDAAGEMLHSQQIKALRDGLAAAIRDGKGESVAGQAEELRTGLKSAMELLDHADKLEPHSLEEAELRALFKKKPSEIAMEALVEGKLRERRMVLQAKEAETNRRAVRVALGAAVIALAVPILPELLDLLLKLLDLLL
jgi:hypothetical protein